jgi:hypothetical protein
MYTAGKILYFDPFFFSNGDTAKRKYFIVLHNDNQNTLIASLPTRGDFIPDSITQVHGCLNDDSMSINCYYFEQGKIITTNNWAFPLPTYAYGYQIDNYLISRLMDVYKVEGAEYDVIGILKKDEFNKILKCFSTSKSVKHKYKKILSKLI